MVEKYLFHVFKLKFDPGLCVRTLNKSRVEDCERRMELVMLDLNWPGHSSFVMTNQRLCFYNVFFQCVSNDTMSEAFTQHLFYLESYNYFG